MKYIHIILFLILISFGGFAQKRNVVWCFGHQAGLKFINSQIDTFTSAVVSRGSCASIADKNGMLQFYVADDTSALLASTIKGAKVYNKNNIIMTGGDSLVGEGWYNELLIIPFPNDSNQCYVICADVVNTAIFGLYYSIVNIQLNSGLGGVTQKNIQLQSFPQVDCLNAVKHGNGRDWWLFFRRWDGIGNTPNNEFHSYLITPNGITNYTIQNVGSLITSGGGNIAFTKDGKKIVYTNWEGLIEKYDFDRCTGIISNPVTIKQIPPTGFNFYFGSALSPSGNVLYVSYQVSTTSYLFQYDLTAPNIAASVDTLWTQSSPIYGAGHLRRAPDYKIYFTCAYVPLTAPMYPYADSIYNMYNMNLSVINTPDSLGAACNFLPYSFYLGGKRTYWGLPNNPDYDLGPDSGSVCDTIISASSWQPAINKNQLHLFYHSAWQKLFVNAQNIKGKNAMLKIFDMNGRIVFSSLSKTNPPYLTEDVDCTLFSKGMYIVSLITERENLVGKFIKE
ncbi:MAG: T9SS type A sorting domain-containing protein [Bacteroidia bacterium]